MLKYVPGREYGKNHIPKGKSKRQIGYQRETRDKYGIPKSRQQISKFIKDHNKELKNFIDETQEYMANERFDEEDFEDIDGERDGISLGGTLEDSDSDSDEDILEDFEIDL